MNSFLVPLLLETVLKIKIQNQEMRNGGMSKRNFFVPIVYQNCPH